MTDYESAREICEALDGIREAMAALGATARQNSDQQSSVEISVSTKGVYTWTIKVYRENAQQAADEARRLNEQMADAYGRPQS